MYIVCIVFCMHSLCTSFHIHCLCLFNFHAHFQYSLCTFFMHTLYSQFIYILQNIIKIPTYLCLFQPMVVCSIREADQSQVELSIRLVAELAPTDVMYLQIYNIMIRKCLDGMGLEELGRHFYDYRQAIKIPAHRLELWPGYKTSMRNHERNVMLCVDTTHKVLRTDSCLDRMNAIRGEARGGNERVGCHK